MLPKLVGYGVDTLILNVCYTDEKFQPQKQELAEALAHELDDLQNEARTNEMAMISPWSFLSVSLFMEPHGAGRQWRWLLTSPLLTLTISRGTFNDLIARARFSSEFLWSEEWCGDALSKVHVFLMELFGAYIHLQVSEIHLCADVVGFDFSQVNSEEHFVTRVRKNDTIYSSGVNGVSLDSHRVSTLRFSNHGSPLSCTIYNKTLEIKQQSGKIWMFDRWRRGVEGEHGGTWDGESDVWRVEFRFKREFLHNLATPIEEAYDILGQFKCLWEYAAGHITGGEDGLPDGWLRYVLPATDDTNRSRWPVHPAWAVVQAAFNEDLENGLGPVVRQRIRERNLERGVASTFGYVSTLAVWLGGAYVAPDADASLILGWLYEAGMEYLNDKGRDFLNEVRKKQKRMVLKEQRRPQDHRQDDGVYVVLIPRTRAINVVVSFLIYIRNGEYRNARTYSACASKTVADNGRGSSGAGIRAYLIIFPGDGKANCQLENRAFTPYSTLVP